MRRIYIGIIAVIAGVIVVAVLLANKQLLPGSLGADNTQTPSIQTQASVQKTFSFPVTDSSGQKITNISYTIISVDKQNQVIIKGQRASAVSGRTFFIVNLKLTNSSSQTIQLNSRDYIRISVDSNKEQYAAEMYNDPILVQPISTEYTHIGFPMDSTENTVTLHVGELTGTKTDIPIHFK